MRHQWLFNSREYYTGTEVKITQENNAGLEAHCKNGNPESHNPINLKIENSEVSEDKKKKDKKRRIEEPQLVFLFFSFVGSSFTKLLFL